MTMGKHLHVLLLAIVLTCTSAEEADDKGATVSETVTIASPEEEQVEEKIDRGKRAIVNNVCFERGFPYYHGDNFTGDNPCIKFRCEFGVHRLLQDECYFQHFNTCIPINTEAEINCVKYRCTRTNENNAYVYRIYPLNSARCQDNYGHCRQPGEIFTFAIKGKVYPNCVCHQTSLNILRYKCRSR